jgi:hypothetical protein
MEQYGKRIRELTGPIWADEYMSHETGEGEGDERAEVH